LLKEGSFDKSMEGVSVVIHCASPFITKWEDPQKELIEPALNGTKNVLSSVTKYPNIKRVVITSSAASVVEHFPTDDGTKVWTEDDWNTTSSIKDGPYRYSKVLAERYAYEWASKHSHVTVVSICPTFILGPPHLKRTEATSIKTIIDLLNGTTKASGGVAAASFGCVDIRDCARAHIAAFEIPEAHGRYITSSEKGIPRLEFANILRKHFPDWPLPDKQIGEIKYGAGNVVNGAYSQVKTKKELRIEYTPLEKTLVDMVHKLIELGVVSKPT